MKEDLRIYESTIKKKHSINLIPKFKDEFRTDLSENFFLSVAVKAIKDLDWDLVFEAPKSVEAKIRGVDNWTEIIYVSYKDGQVKVKSESLGKAMWDQGMNSMRVRLFIYAFRQIEKNYDKAALSNLEIDYNRKINLDDYEIPETLPLPIPQKKPQFWIPILGGIVSALTLGFTVAFLTLNGLYIVGVYEAGLGFIIGFILTQLVKVSNYTSYKKLNYLLFAMVIITYLSNKYFQYLLILNQDVSEPISFSNFIKGSILSGLKIQSWRIGWFGFIATRMLQLIVSYVIGNIVFSTKLTKYLINRVPMAVVKFAYYHFIKGKTESEVRDELSKMGWSNSPDQNKVLESIPAFQDLSELRRYAFLNST